jgi:alpha-beta hydrolase superfamily lysophospholipase
MKRPAQSSGSDEPQKNKFVLQAAIALVLILAGVLISLPRPYHEKTYLIEAGGCRLETTVFEAAPRTSGQTASESPNSTSTGTLILFHGLAANRKIMNYLAEGFALKGLRVFVPDLPGHGRTAGPFSAERAEQCGENLLRELRSRGFAPPDSTILAGHSMGGAMAIRIAARVPVAAVIALSPAPMQAKHGAATKTLLFPDAPALPANSLIMNGTLEPEELRGNAQDLLHSGRDVNSRYEILPGVTHGGIILSAAALRLAQRWAATALQNAARGVSAHRSGEHASFAPGTLPSRLPLLGFTLGFVGLLLIAPPFLREIAAMSASGTKEIQRRGETQREDGNSSIALWRTVLEIVVVGILVAEVLRYWTPLRLVRLFEGDYLAGYLLLVGLALCGLHWKAFINVIEFRTWAALGALLGGVILVLLFTAWFELSLSEAWLNAARWQLFPLLFISLIPCLVAEEILLGPIAAEKTAKSNAHRLLLATLYRLLLWLPLVFGILILHSGEILMVLLVAYFFLLSVLQRRGMDVVREVTGSAAAAALFGAILLAGFFLVIFPLV